MFLFEKGVNDLTWEDSGTLDRWHSSMTDTVEFPTATNRETNESIQETVFLREIHIAIQDLLFFQQDLKNASQEKVQFSIVSSPLWCYCVLSNIST